MCETQCLSRMVSVGNQNISHLTTGNHSELGQQIQHQVPLKLDKAKTGSTDQRRVSHSHAEESFSHSLLHLVAPALHPQSYSGENFAQINNCYYDSAPAKK